MKLLIIGFWLILSVSAASYLVAAEGSTTPAQPAAPAAVNKKCPISGDDVNPKAKTVTYKDKVVGFCCDDCVALFSKNPEKYADKIK